MTKILNFIDDYFFYLDCYYPRWISYIIKSFSIFPIIIISLPFILGMVIVMPFVFLYKNSKEEN